MTITTSDTFDSFPALGGALAASYLSLGWVPIPLEARGKRPLLDWKPFQTAPPTLADICAWWSQWPDANIGLVTGPVSGLVVLDLDSLSAVEDFVRRWNQAGCGLIALPIVRTANGVHVYFQHPGGVVPNRVGLLPGWDVRGDGGYVVAAGSTHATGALYRFLVTPRDASSVNGHPAGLALPPTWLSDLLVSPLPKVVGGTDGPIPEGKRNDTLYRIARALKARGLSGAAIEAAVWAENDERCSPPLPEDELTDLLPIRLTQLASKGHNGLWLVWSRAEPHPCWAGVMERSRTRADAGLRRRRLATRCTVG